MKVTICDICGKQVGLTWRKIKIGSRTGKWGKDDVCFDCYDELRKAIKKKIDEKNGGDGDG